MTKKIDFHIGNMGEFVEMLSLQNKVYFCSHLTDELKKEFPNHQINVMYGSGVNYFDKTRRSDVLNFVFKVYNAWINNFSKKALDNNNIHV